MNTNMHKYDWNECIIIVGNESEMNVIKMNTCVYGVNMIIYQIAPCGDRSEEERQNDAPAATAGAIAGC